jgi:hypothetical protein
VCRAAEHGLTISRILRFPDIVSRPMPNDGMPEDAAAGAKEDGRTIAKMPRAARSRNDGRSRCARPGLVAPAMTALIADDETFPIYETPTDARRWWIAQTRRFPRGFSRLGCGSTIVASAMAYLRPMDFGASPLACASNVGRAQRSAASPILIYR